jgi:carbonic anhydrase
MNLIAPAAERLGPRREDLTSYLDKLELAAVENSLRNLMTFPCVRILVERGKLQLHGAYFGIASGVLMVRDPETGAFAPAVPDMPARISRMRATEVQP